MKIASVSARYLAGFIFFVMGLNGFLHFIPFPPPPGIAGQFMGALYVSHYLWVIFAFQVIAGVLLANRYVPLAVALLAPVIVNILTFHALMAPSGLPLQRLQVGSSRHLQLHGLCLNLPASSLYKRTLSDPDRLRIVGLNRHNGYASVFVICG